jgi:hypothetical protein
MKKTIIALFAITLLSFGVVAVKKEFTVKAELPEWQKHINKLETIRAIIDESNLPNQQVKFVVKSIDSLEMLIVPQLQKQLSDTTTR